MLITRTKISGLAAGASALPAGTYMKGLSVQLVCSFADRVDGVSISTLLNLHYEFNGIMLAGLRNKTTKGKGLQIALFNTSQEGRLIQIGLVNRIGKRTLPFINFNL